jgi:hypothetical protein
MSHTAEAADSTVMKVVAVGCRATDISRHANGGRYWGGMNNETMFDHLRRLRTGSSAISAAPSRVHGA